MPKETYIPSLFSLFRQYGYDGATLAKISEATGLGKASLYHHFPGGKDEMVASVLGYSERWLQDNVLTLLESEGSPQARLQKMCDRIDDLYAGGTQPCLLAILQSGTGRAMFHDKVNAALEAWIGAITAVVMETGLDATTARRRGETALITIQGALMLSQGLDDPTIFQRALQTLPERLVQSPM
jgi:TetR/AcrR family transcriptional repressor of lmrAB and yxaGH operons